MFLVFFAIWIICNGRVTLEICLFGLAISAAVYWFFCRILGYRIRYDLLGLRMLLRLLGYLGVLVWEIFKANGHVMRLVLSPKEEIRPKLIKFRCGLKSAGTRVTLANSITLTPGTITVSLRDDMYWVHALDTSFVEGIEDTVFEQKLKEMEERADV